MHQSSTPTAKLQITRTGNYWTRVSFQQNKKEERKWSKEIEEETQSTEPVEYTSMHKSIRKQSIRSTGGDKVGFAASLKFLEKIC